MPELLITWNIFEYQVNIEDPAVTVALEVIRVFLIYSECFKYSKTTGMQGEKKLSKELKTSSYDSAGQIFPQSCSTIEAAKFQDRVVMLLISSYLPVSRSVKYIYTPQFKDSEW